MNYIEFFNSPLVQRLGAGLFIVSLGAAIAFLIYALSLYGRARERNLQAQIDPPWGLLIATWRDSLLITVLFVCEGLLYKMISFAGIASPQIDSILNYGGFLEPILSLIILLIVVYICIARILRLRDWMRANGIE